MGTGHCSAGEQCAAPPACGKAAEWQEEDFSLCFYSYFSNVWSKPFFPPVGGWFSSLETLLSPSPDALCLQKIAQCCSTFPKSTPREQRHARLSSQTWFTAPLPSTSVPIAFWLCTDTKAKIHLKIQSLSTQWWDKEASCVLHGAGRDPIELRRVLPCVCFNGSSCILNWLLFHFAWQKQYLKEGFSDATSAKIRGLKTAVCNQAKLLHSS